VDALLCDNLDRARDLRCLFLLLLLLDESVAAVVVVVVVVVFVAMLLSFSTWSTSSLASC
jgi:hypothetical protein